MSLTYHEEEKQKAISTLREIQKELPPFLESFFVGISQKTAPKTRVGYALDLKSFFQYLGQSHPILKEIPMKQWVISDLEQIEAEDIDRFLEYISFYCKEDAHHPNQIRQYQNEERAKARKLSAIRSMYTFFCKRKKIKTNPAAIVDMPKIHEKQIIRLDAGEIAMLLDEIESGDKMTERQKQYHKKTKKRDLALITLLLGTGMRISECIGLNRKDINFLDNSLKIIRKGGKETYLYFGEEVEQALKDYLVQREKEKTLDLQEDALFLSMQGKRLTVRAAHNLVKKYAFFVTPNKNISPHKLRSTFGTQLYRETRDIYLVADALGHTNVDVTRKHYAEIEDDIRRSVSKYIKLRKD